MVYVEKTFDSGIFIYTILIEVYNVPNIILSAANIDGHWSLDFALLNLLF